MRSLKLMICLAMLAVMASPAIADKLRQTDIAPNANVVIHLDWDAARTGAPFRQLAKQATAGLIESGFVSKRAAELGAMSTLHGMTLVVTHDGDTYQVVHAETKLQSLQDIFSEAKGYVVVKHGKHAIYHWLDLPDGLKEGQGSDEIAKVDDAEPSPIYAAVCAEGRFIISKQLRTVVEVLERYDGQGESIADDEFAKINHHALENTVLLFHATSGNALESIVPGVPVNACHAVLGVQGNICEFACQAELGNALMAATVANSLKAENLAAMLQSSIKSKASVESAVEEETSREDGKRSVSFGVGVKNVDAETMHAMLAKAFRTTIDGAIIRIRFRGVVEPSVTVDKKKLGISLQLDGAQTSTAAKEETIR
ncbi:MAG: hypothetical protein MPJ50_16600 [Pirellulales bacterium]|nr:hypothetical protein [Pirellulales bacterium]